MFLVILGIIWNNEKINYFFWLFEFVDFKIDFVLCSKLFYVQFENIKVNLIFFFTLLINFLFISDFGKEIMNYNRGN